MELTHHKSEIAFVVFMTFVGYMATGKIVNQLKSGELNDAKPFSEKNPRLP
jgi:hypothetical protein